MNNMYKRFNTTGLCLPEKHYMADISPHLHKIINYVEEGAYFSINCARQYGKTTTLNILAHQLENDFLVVSLDFQALGNASYQNENIFSLTFAEYFLRELQMQSLPSTVIEQLNLLKTAIQDRDSMFVLFHLFGHITSICQAVPRPLVLIIDEIDSASNNQVFLDFLAQLRYYYLQREKRTTPAFYSVILAGVHDVRRLKLKIRSENDHKYNSPWNIAADIDIDLSLTFDGIRQMLSDYEHDHNTGMDIPNITRLIYDYTSGYPFLVSRICKLVDEDISISTGFCGKAAAWTKEGILSAVRKLISERNTLFESLTEKLDSYPELERILYTLLFIGKPLPYNTDTEAITLASMFGFIKNKDENIAITNRIFETRLYNGFLAEKARQMDISQIAADEKNQFIVNGQLDMERVLQKFVSHYTESFGEYHEHFLEDNGRCIFLLYMKPIINGTGNYYIESKTRTNRRTDLIIDFCGQQKIIELKIWHGEEYNRRGEEQLTEYLEEYHLKRGYMVSFNFNKKKQIGIHKIVCGDKVLIEAVV